MIRRARPLSADWQEDPDAYFGCWRCGLRLASLSGPSAMRPSDHPLDHVPDPIGSLRLMLRDPTVVKLISGSRNGGFRARKELSADHLHPGLKLKPYTRPVSAEGRQVEVDLLAEFRSQPLLAVLIGPGHTGEEPDRLVRSGWVEAAFLMTDRGDGSLEVVDSIVRPKSLN